MLGIKLVSLIIYMVFIYPNLKYHIKLHVLKTISSLWLPRTNTILDIVYL